MLIGLLFGIVIGVVLNALVLWVVSQLGLGLRVKGFGGAIVAALVIAVVSGIVTWLLGLVGISAGGGLLGGIVGLVISAIVLLISDRILDDLEVSGFGGALVAAIAMGIVAWLGALLVRLIGLG